ncbi:MAG: N-6 DNA methylase [Candidatus Binatia bacterium]
MTHAISSNGAYESVLFLTDSPTEKSEVRNALTTFASTLDWQPSDQLYVPSVSDVANAHLIVEHGLRHTAVITFANCRFEKMKFSAQRQILSISYNNLIDWHICISRHTATYVYNRVDPWAITATVQIEREGIDALRRQNFERLSADQPAPGILGVDDALIRTISEWRRQISAAFDGDVTLEALSALFNALLLARACEDHVNNVRVMSGATVPQAQSLLEKARSCGDQFHLGSALMGHVQRVTGQPAPSYLIDSNLLAQFDSLPSRLSKSIVAELYKNKFAPYEYDFSLISKHALSRIYEKYVSLLRVPSSNQMTLFPPIPTEERDKAFGNVFTPQFIARFFARYLRVLRPAASYPRLRLLDPACGSGIFLRSFLELQLDPAEKIPTPTEVRDTFGLACGIDRDANACAAARLSLSLLYLVLADRFPDQMEITTANALDLLGTERFASNVDAVFANPPFVALGTQSREMREQLASFIGQTAIGRSDLYLAFIKGGIEALRPGGIGMYVLPRTFLLGKSAGPLRRLLHEKCWIRCVADLSAIPVFEDIGSYVVLLVFERKATETGPAPPVTILECRGQVGKALQDITEGRITSVSAYSIYETDQSLFGQPTWVPTPPAQATVQQKLKALPRLSEFLDVKQGYISGKDEVFLLRRECVPRDGGAPWAPLLRDRDMSQYVVPRRTDWFVFYPYRDGKKLSRAELESDFPNTWEYLKAHRHSLASRTSLARYNKEWWEPLWPRSPEIFERPKIVSPHLIIVPRFALDFEKGFIVSRAPVLLSKDEGAERDLLRFFVGILNSSVTMWYLSSHSPTYQRGYLMLENAVLKDIPVPDPSRVPVQIKRNLLELVKARTIAGKDSSGDIGHQIDDLVAELYELSDAQRSIIGFPN